MADNELQRRSFLRGLIVGTTALAANNLGVIVKASPVDVEAFGTVKDTPVKLASLVPEPSPHRRGPGWEFPDRCVYNCHGELIFHVENWSIEAPIDGYVRYSVDGYPGLNRMMSRYDATPYLPTTRFLGRP